MDTLYLLLCIILLIALYIQRKSRKLSEHHKLGENAVIIGGGIGGIIAAKVLSKRFNRITVIERDEIPEGPAMRRGCPQATQFHALLVRGTMIIEDLFPGVNQHNIDINLFLSNFEGVNQKKAFQTDIIFSRFSEEMKKHNAAPVNVGLNMWWNTPYGFYPRYSGDTGLAASRAMIEWLLRNKLKEQTPNLTFIEKTTVIGLLFDKPTNTVTGVKIRSKNGEEEDVFADLSVLSGAHTKQGGVSFLQSIGMEITREEVNAGVGYTSALYKFDEPPVSDGKLVKVLYIQANPSQGDYRGLALGQIENDTFHFNWYAYNNNHPPTTDEELMEYTRSLRTPVGLEFLTKAKRISPFVPYRDATTRRVRCDKYPNWPENFILLGDSMANFTPIYAQGMTYCALSALALGEVLSRQTSGNLKGFSKAYNKAVLPILDQCWATAAGEDFCVPGVTSNTSPPTGFRFIHQYISYAMQLCVDTQSASLHYDLVCVMHLKKGPGVLFHPRFLFPILRLWLKDLLNTKQKHH